MLPIPTRFGLTQLWSDIPPEDPPPGTAGTIITHRVYDKGALPRIFAPNGHFSGRPEAWRDGGTLGIDPPLHFLPSGSSVECLAALGLQEVDPLLSLLFGITLTVGVLPTLEGQGQLAAQVQGGGLVYTRPGTYVSGDGFLAVRISGGPPVGLVGLGRLVAQVQGGGAVVATVPTLVAGSARLVGLVQGEAYPYTVPPYPPYGAGRLVAQIQGGGAVLAYAPTLVVGSGRVAAQVQGGGVVVSRKTVVLGSARLVAQVQGEAYPYTVPPYPPYGAGRLAATVQGGGAVLTPGHTLVAGAGKVAAQVQGEAYPYTVPPTTVVGEGKIDFSFLPP